MRRERTVPVLEINDLRQEEQQAEHPRRVEDSARSRAVDSREALNATRVNIKHHADVRAVLGEDC